MKGAMGKESIAFYIQIPDICAVNPITTLYIICTLGMQHPERPGMWFCKDELQFSKAIVNLDTDVVVVDATCENTPDGSITLSPQTGVGPYTYQWSVPGNGSSQSGLLPGTYFATVTDNNGTTEELIIAVGTSPGSPQAQATILDVCSFNAQEEFDLTTVESIVNMGSGFEVIWYENANLTGEILFPETFFTGGTTVYAVVDNGSCQSAPVSVVLTLYPTPTGNEASIIMCDDDEDGFVDFNLSSLDDEISGGIGPVSWYLSNNLTNPVLDPTSLWSHTQFVYAHVFDGHCLSPPTFIWLEVLDNPQAIPLDTHFCGDPSGVAVINLTALDLLVSGGVGTVEWFFDEDTLLLIPDPVNFQTTTTTVYAVVTNVICASSPEPVELNIDPSPTANPLTLNTCNDGSNTGLFALHDADVLVSGGTGTVNWFLDVAGVIPVTNPNAFITPTTTVYAIVDNGFCITGPVAIQLNVIDEIVGNTTSISACTDMGGQGLFDLTSLESIINPGLGSISWYQDAAGLIPVVQPGMYMSGAGIVYAQINYGGCQSSLIPINVTLLSPVVATPAQMSVCDNGSGMPIFDLTTMANTISGGIGIVSWYSDPAGMMVIPTPAMYNSGAATIYAQVTSGLCESPIVPIQLLVLSTPQVIPVVIEVCGDVNQQAVIDLTSYDATISANTGIVSWYLDAAQTQSIPVPASFLTGSSTVYVIVDDGTCVSPVKPILITIIDDLQATSVPIELCVIDLDTPIIDLTVYDAAINGGIGDVVWYMDAAGMKVIASPTTFSPTVDGIYAQVVSGGCISSVVNIPVIIDQAFTPQPFCAFTSGDSVSITWQNVAEAYELSYLINGLPSGGPLTIMDTTFSLGGLEQGDLIMLIITTVNNGICNTPLSVSITCTTESCPTAELVILYPETICSEGDPFQLDVMIDGLSGTPAITWSGIGVNADGRYDPSVAGFVPNTVSVTVMDGQCAYVDSVELRSVLTPVASFYLVGSPCVDSTMELIFDGLAFFGGSEWNWDLDGADVMPHNMPVDFYVSWDQPGEYELSLSIDSRGCLSDTFRYPVLIGETPDTFSVSCVGEDYNELVVGWNPVTGATSYEGITNEGIGVLSGTTYTITGLQDNTIVDIIIEAQGSGECGPTIAMVQCKTPLYLESAEFIPNIFSPDGDGINDVLFVQANNGIAEVLTFRIFDRWGNMVFEDQIFAPNDPAHGWDGVYKGKMMNPGVYVYHAEIKTKDGEVISKTGDITVVRN